MIPWIASISQQNLPKKTESIFIYSLPNTKVIFHPQVAKTTIFKKYSLFTGHDVFNILKYSQSFIAYI